MQSRLRSLRLSPVVLAFVFLATLWLPAAWAQEMSFDDQPIRLYGAGEDGNLKEEVSPFSDPKLYSEDDIRKSGELLAKALQESGEKSFVSGAGKDLVALNFFDESGKRWALVFHTEKLDKAFTIPGTNWTIHFTRNGDSWSLSICYGVPGCQVCVQILRHRKDGPIEMHFDINCGFRFRLWCEDITKPLGCRRLW